MNFDDELLRWVETLTSLPPDRVREAWARVESWKIAHVIREFEFRPTLDSAVAVTLLAEGIQELRAAGVPESKLMAKLRRDPDVWPTWAELRAAVLLHRVADREIQFHLEPDRRAKHADFRFSIPGTTRSVDVEFKALGLSDEEVAFSRRVAPALDYLVPSTGLATFHSRMNLERFPLESIDRDAISAEASESCRNVPGYPPGLAGACIVGHYGEQNYAERLYRRFRDEIALQLPDGAQGWAAFYWTNGAPLRTILTRLRWSDTPENIAGLVLVGDALAFPSANIHSFTFIAERGADSEIVAQVASTNTTDLGRLVLERFEASSGVRPTLLRDNQLHRDLLRRDGTRRILPFSLLLDKDPPNSLGKGLPTRPT